jgi:hypothetical protein
MFRNLYIGMTKHQDVYDAQALDYANKMFAEEIKRRGLQSAGFDTSVDFFKNFQLPAISRMGLGGDIGSAKMLKQGLYGFGEQYGITPGETFGAMGLISSLSGGRGNLFSTKRYAPRALGITGELYEELGPLPKQLALLAAGGGVPMESMGRILSSIMGGFGPGMESAVGGMGNVLGLGRSMGFDTEALGGFGETIGGMMTKYGGGYGGAGFERAGGVMGSMVERFGPTTQAMQAAKTYTDLTDSRRMTREGFTGAANLIGTQQAMMQNKLGRAFLSKHGGDRSGMVLMGLLSSMGPGQITEMSKYLSRTLGITLEEANSLYRKVQSEKLYTGYAMKSPFVSPETLAAMRTGKISVDEQTAAWGETVLAEVVGGTPAATAVQVPDDIAKDISGRMGIRPRGDIEAGKKALLDKATEDRAKSAGATIIKKMLEGMQEVLTAGSIEKTATALHNLSVSLQELAASAPDAAWEAYTLTPGDKPQ